MKVLDKFSDFPKKQYVVLTIGFFDGVHFGHQKILNRIVEIAAAHNGVSAVLTFWPHPRFVLNKQPEDLKLLTTFSEKEQLIADQHINYLVRIPFTKEFSQFSSQKFIQEILVEGLGVNKLVIGYDHHFGHNREAGFEYLRDNSFRFGFEVEGIPAQDIDNIAVSSTKIRSALTDGNMKTSFDYLGRPYSIKGKVVAGRKIGRKLGFPTANIEVAEQYKLIPADGIYAVMVSVNSDSYKGMLYIGPRPTLNGVNRTIEVNIFDFDEDIYGREIAIDFIRQIRKDSKFSDLNLLKEQLIKDRQEALKML
ncbi:MAG: bifunctional riboflavin kinase/FAD synthetase [Bacteroidetes bacterium]|nr:bifunctional riboflavin kinase/FAD synthetase [Bacteroidota bacterium]MDA1119736.1 bifunctional riboflavin kinase/FAD synthetase [Bacteroidota bacterium]